MIRGYCVGITGLGTDVGTLANNIIGTLQDS